MPSPDDRSIDLASILSHTAQLGQMIEDAKLKKHELCEVFARVKNLSDALDEALLKQAGDGGTY